MADASRRDLLLAAMAGAAGLSACAEPEAPEEGGGDRLRQAAGGASEADGIAISLETVRAAEKIAALEFADEERAQMLDALGSAAESLVQLRKLKHPNDLQPALVFDPRLRGVRYDLRQGADVRLGGAYDAAPGTDDDVAFATAAQQANWLAAGRITSRQLTDLYLARIERHAPALENFVTVTADIARAQADASDRRRAAGRLLSPIDGLAYGLKDIIDVKDVAATWGAEPYRDRVGAADAAVYDRLRRAGAVLLGKTSVGAIAYGDIWFGGRTRNPWDPREGSSGSSAGSASATAAGLCSFSVGTETLGSIVSPSERCGTTGLRPTFGRVSRAGAMALCWSLDKIGPICRSVEDAALVLSALNGYDPADASSIAAGFSYDGASDLSGLRIGYVPGWFEEADPVDREALMAARTLGARMVETDWPDLPYGLLVDQLIVEAAAAFEELTLENLDDEMTWQDDAAWPNSFRRARFFPAVDLVQIDRLRRKVMTALHEAIDGIDVLLAPNFAGGVLTATNFTGHPQLTLRAGFRDTAPRSLWNDAAEGGSAPTARTPHNVSLIAGLFEERMALRIGRALEAAMGVQGERPAL